VTRHPFTYRLAAVCPAGHEAVIVEARLDPADNSTLAAAEAAVPAAGVVARCPTCGAACTLARESVDGRTVSELTIGEFNRRAAGKAPPRNYG
jgi:hypothetical protein